jgi:predicted nucleic acid-binding protein
VLLRVTLDSNVFISAIKGNEEYSRSSRKIVEMIGRNFLLVEPSIVFAEVGNAVARNMNVAVAEEAMESLKQTITSVRVCDERFCREAGIYGALLGIYSADSLYWHTARESGALLVSLDREHFIQRVKKGSAVKAFYVDEFLRLFRR